MKAIVDADACTGCGLCVATCPEVFDMNDDDDLAIVIADPVPAAAEDTCQEAAEGCNLEILFRDIYTINFDRPRLKKWVEMTKSIFDM